MIEISYEVLIHDPTLTFDVEIRVILNLCQVEIFIIFDVFRQTDEKLQAPYHSLSRNTNLNFD